MKAITVREPWASLIVHHGKDIENRSRNIVGDHRGPTLIHVSRTLVVAGDPAWSIAADAGMDTDRFAGDDLHPGHLIGIVDVVGTHISFPAQHARGDLWQAACCESEWGQTDLIMSADGKSGRPPVHIELAAPRAIEPLACTGALGLWEVPAEIAARVWRSEVGA